MGYGIWDMGYCGIWDMGYCGIWDMGYGICVGRAEFRCMLCQISIFAFSEFWILRVPLRVPLRDPWLANRADMGYGIWDMGYGIWDIVGYGIWDIVGYGIWDMGYVLAVQNFVACCVKFLFLHFRSFGF